MGDRASLRRESGCFGVNRHRVGMCFRLGDSSGIYHVTGRPASRYTRARRLAPNVHWGGDGCRMHRFLRMASAQKARASLATQRVTRRRGDCGIATTSGLPVGWLVDCRTDVVVQRRAASRLR